MATTKGSRVQNKEKKNSSNFVLNIDDQNCHDSKTIANYFNEVFTTVADKRIYININYLKIKSVLTVSLLY